MFADYPIDPAPHATHVLADSEVLAFSLGGLSKSAGLPQVKLGWIGFGGPVAKVDEAMAAYEIVADTYLSVSTPVQVAAPSLIESGAAIRSQIQARIARQPGIVAPAGGRACVGRRPARRRRLVGGVAGARGSIGRIAGARAARQDDVLVHPGYFFDFAKEAFVVVSLLVETARFDAAIARVLARAAAGAAA